jgi:hypothetical protein
MKKQPIPKENEIDIVYLWVDTNNKSYIENKNYYSKKYKLNNFWSPTEDHNEIIYSIKSVRKYMLWVRNIYVCCPKGHKIKNFDLKKYGVKYISNEEILGKENCPNFNSHSLELYTHKIKNLSNYFIQFNDDCFINSKVNLSDFYNFETNKIKYYYENRLCQSFFFLKSNIKFIQKLNKSEKYYFWMTHMPRFFYKNDIKEIIDIDKKKCIQTKKSKFRNREDLGLVYIYGYYLLYKNKGEFIFLKNFSSKSFNSKIIGLIKQLINKLKFEGIFQTIKQIYLEFFYKKKLHKNKIFSNEKIYSVISINSNYKENKENIKFVIKNNIKFVCLNDTFISKNKNLKNKVIKENYGYFYKNFLRKMKNEK